MRRGIGLAAMLVIGCGGGTSEPGGIVPLTEEPAYAVVLSDYTSTAIAMLASPSSR